MYVTPPHTPLTGTTNLVGDEDPFPWSHHQQQGSHWG